MERTKTCFPLTKLVKGKQNYKFKGGCRDFLKGAYN